VDLDALRQIEPLASLPRYQLLRASRHLLWRRYAPGELILPHQVHIDLKGLVYRGKVQIATVQEGCRQVVGHVLAGQPINGDFRACYTQPVELRAVEPTTLCLVPLDGLHVASLFERAPRPTRLSTDTPHIAIASTDRTTAKILVLSTFVLAVLLAWYWQTPWRILLSKLTYGLASHYLADTEYTEALSLLQTSVNLNPRLASAYSDMGYILFEQERFREAQTSFQKAVAADSAFAAAQSNLGLTYLDAGQVKLASEALKEAVTLNPESAAAWANLGTAELQAGHPEEAIRAYRAALRLDPDNLVVRVNLGILLYDHERLSEARDHLQAALDVQPDLPRARVILGAIALSDGDPARAWNEFQAVADELADDPQLHFYLALWYEETGQWEVAERRLTRVLELQPHPDLAALARSHLDVLPSPDQSLFAEETKDE
jgi:tetratricopeptide (TPR) repeat protein